MRLKASACFLTATLALLLAGCSVNVGGGSSSGPQLNSITVTPTGRGIPAGGTVQFTATGSYSNGVTKNITDSVQWSAAPSAVASITAAGMATGLSAGSATITATSGSVNGAAALTIDNGVLSAVQVRPLGPALTTNSSQAFTATAIYSDGFIQDVTATATWSSSNSNVATVSAGQLSALGSAGQTTVAALFNGVNGSTAVNVVAPPSTAPNLNGSYAFQFTSVDARGAAYFLGSFTADGNGKITSGFEDANTASGIATKVPLSGGYFVYPDGRGEITFNQNAIYPDGVTFRFVLVSGGTVGQAIEFDNHGSAQGTFELQDSSAFNNGTLSGNYVFRVNGFNPADNPAGPVGEAGVFNADGVSSVTTGLSDIVDNGVSVFNNNLTGNFAIDSDGRGSLSLTDSFGTTSNFVVYVVSATKVRLMQTDSGSATWLAGVAEQQEASHMFSNKDLSGPYTFLLDTAPNQSTSRFDVTGLMVFDSNGGIVTGLQQEAQTNGQQTQITGGTYSMDTTGRAVIDALISGGTRNYIAYSLSASRFYLLEQFTSPGLGGTGPGDIQSVAIKNSTLSGNYGFSASTVGISPTGMVVWLDSDGVSSIGGVADELIKASPNNTLASVVLSANYNVSVNGRTTLSLNDNQLVVQGLVFYLVDPDQAQVLGAVPDLDGTLLKQ